MSLAAVSYRDVYIPPLHPGQERIVQTRSRFNAASCGRRFGKTQFGIDRVVNAATLGYPVAWCAPTYKILADAWRQLREVLSPATARYQERDHRIELYRAGGVVEGWSLDDPDAARGRKYKRIIVDEAGMVKRFEEVWNGALRPTLTDLKGDAWFFGTPKGRNYFWQLYQLGQDEMETEWASWQMPTTANPCIPDLEAEVADARRTMPDRYFRQEYLAEFIDDAGGVFRRVVDAAEAPEQWQAHPGHDYAVGADWGKSDDFTVFAVLDLTERHICHVDRSNRVDYVIQSNRLKALCERFRPITVVAERNSMGEPIVERLQRDDIPVQPFLTTNATKAKAIEDLALAFERGDIKIINDATVINELQSFESKRLPSGLTRYQAPEGMHDDIVMAVAMAWTAAAGPKVWVL